VLAGLKRDIYKMLSKKFVDYYMKLAQNTAELSSAERLKVGSVIVRDHQILATGYNGTPSGWDNNCEIVELMDSDAGGWMSPEEILEAWPFEGRFWIGGQEVITRYRLRTKPEVIHSESNALTKIARSTESSVGATMFCTHAPCMDCAKLIYQSGISKLYYRNHYRDDNGLNFLIKGGVEVEQHIG
jgi:dCMP deaminase